MALGIDAQGLEQVADDFLYTLPGNGSDDLLAVRPLKVDEVNQVRPR